MKITTLDQKGLDLIKELEGCILHPYKDSVGIPTIGTGMTFYPGGKRVTMSDHPITQAQADSMFLQVAQNFMVTVDSCCPDDLNQNQFNALFCLCYNIGTGGFKGSTVVKLINKGIRSGDDLKTAWYAWNKADGKVNSGLTNRREKEYEIFTS